MQALPPQPLGKPGTPFPRDSPSDRDSSMAGVELRAALEQRLGALAFHTRSGIPAGTAWPFGVDDTRCTVYGMRLPKLPVPGVICRRNVRSRAFLGF